MYDKLKNYTINTPLISPSHEELLYFRIRQPEFDAIIEIPKENKKTKCPIECVIEGAGGEWFEFDSDSEKIYDLLSDKIVYLIKKYNGVN